jgi:3-methyladenine DNA glycosylase Tag
MGGETHQRIKSRSLNDYLAVMSQAVFQAGIRWATIESQWERLCDAFNGFDARVVARYREDDVARIMSQPGILHSERKIQATIHNALTMLDIDREHRGFRKYLRSHHGYQALTADLMKRFSNVGEISAYYFLFRVGEPVPPFHRWIKTVKGDHPRIREMVATKSTK